MKHLIRRGLGVALAVVMATGLLSSCGSDYDPVKDIMGYKMFFIFVMACCLITFLVTAFLKIDPEFGKKKE